MKKDEKLDSFDFGIYKRTLMGTEDLKYKTKKGIHWTFISQLAHTGLQFTVGVVMARLLSPGDYGITALPAVFIAIAMVFIESGFGSALIRKPVINDDDLTTSFYYSIAVGLVSYAILFFSAPLIAKFYNTPVLTPLVRVTSISFLWMPLSTPQNIILKRKLDFKTPTRISVTTKIIGATIGIGFAYRGYGVWALVIMHVVSSFLSFIQTWFVVKWLPRGHWSKESFRYLWGYGNKILASSMLDNVYRNIVPIIIGKFYSTTDLGLYNRAKNYANLPAQQGTSVLQQVTFPVLSKIQDDSDTLSKAYRKMLKASAFVIFPAMMILAGLAKPFIVLLVTEKWIESVILLQIICFSSMWYPIQAINLNLLMVKGRSDLFLRLEIWKKCLGIAVMVSTLPFGLVWFVSAGVISTFISLFINTYYTGKLIGVGFIRQMRDLLPTYVISVLLFIVIMVVNSFISNLWIQLVVGLGIGAGLYLCLTSLFDFSELKDVKYMLKRK